MSLTASPAPTGQFVAVASSGDNRVMTSPDGTTWTARTSGFSTTPIRDVTYGDGVYVAVGDSGKLTTSTDGTTWTARTSAFDSTAMFGVGYGNGLFVAVGNTGKMTTSSSGISNILFQPITYSTKP